MNYLNGNDRIYDLNACNKIIEEFKDKKGTIGVVYGELGHPENDTTFQPLSNISHTIENMWMVNNIVRAKIKILNTNVGKELKKNINDYVFSSRSIGYVDQNKIANVTKFLTIDAINWKEDAYYKRRLREKKLKKILR